MLAVARTFALVGVFARDVQVEVDVHTGLPTFAVVGLPDTAVRESRERVRAALVNSGFEFPLRRITANLAPADLRKAGAGFDLAIAAALLAACGELDAGVLDRLALAGELALDGTIRPIPGVLAMAEQAMANGAGGIAVATASAGEAALLSGIEVIPLDTLGQLVALGRGDWSPPPVVAPQPNGDAPGLPDLADLRGQPSLCRALEVSAAGAHSLLLLGPPGAGKSLAARRLPSLLPPLGTAEAIEVTRIAGACGRLPPGVLAGRPFRAPHHTISAAGLIGGGSTPRAGEITMAHRGVLFLDELGEFNRSALEALRQPLEDGQVILSRARETIELPCRFMLVAAANECPCGRGRDSESCRCSSTVMRRYQAKLSGALADRIDITLAIAQPDAATLSGDPGVASAVVRRRVAEARRRQEARLGPGMTNAETSLVELRRHCRLDCEGKALMAQSQRKLGLSGRGHDRVLRVARTLADLAGSETIGSGHLGEALTLRRRTSDPE